MPTPLWNLSLDASSRGMCLAREANRLLIWTENNWLLWMNRKGERQAQVHFAAGISAAAVSEDGSAFVVATAKGRLNWLAPDLTSRWEKKVKGKPTAVALDPLGLFAAVATDQGQLALFHADGEQVGEVVCPRPARHLAFVPGVAILAAASDLGWAAVLDIETEEWLWRDTPVVGIGSLAVAGAGEPICLACFSEGLRGYHQNGNSWGFAAPFPPCRAAALSYDAQRVVIQQLDGIITGWSQDRQPLFSFRPDAAVTAMALSALGETLFLALNDRRVLAVDVRK